MKKARLKLPVTVTLMLAWVFAATVVGQVVMGYLLVFILGKEQFVQPMWTGVYSALSYLLSLFLVVFVPQKLIEKWKITREELGLKDLPTWTDIGLAPIGFFIATILSGLLVSIFSNFSWFDAEAAQEIGFNYYLIGFDRIIAFLSLVVIAPIAEEIIFRGWLYGLMRKKTSMKLTPVWSMILSSILVSLLFGLVHFQWNVSVNVFAMSLVLCGLREITGTIYAGILMHMIKNGVAFWLLYVVGIH